MVKSVRAPGTTALVAMALAAPLSGCGQVLGIEDWQPGSGGQGGEGGRPITTTGMQVQASATSATTGTQVQASASSGAGGMGQGGQDPGCDGTCMQAPPGWLGPVTVAWGDKAAPLPACGPEWSVSSDWQTGPLVAPDATCNPCSCSAPAGGSCALTQVSIGIYTDGNCSSTSSVATTPVTAPNTCTQIDLGTTPGFTLSAKLQGQALPTVGSGCTPSGGGAVKPPAYFEHQGRICDGLSTTTTCTDGGVCVPKPPAEYHLCVFQPAPDGANLACPTGWLQLPYFYTDIADMRDCTPCQCGVPFNQSCSMYTSIYSAANCPAPPSITIANNMCSPVGTPQSLFAKVATGAPSGGSCVPTTSNPIGEVWGTDRTLVCCAP